MLTLFKSILSLVKESTGMSSKVSSARIQAYLVLMSTLAYTVTFVIIEIANASMSLLAGKPYAPTNESIVVLGMLLSHHIAIMFSKRSESPNQITPVGLRTASTSTTQTVSASTMNSTVGVNAQVAPQVQNVVATTTKVDKAVVIVDDPDADPTLADQ